MGRRSTKTLFLALIWGLTGCSVAVPEVVSLLSNVSFFKLNQTQFRIDNLSQLSGITVSAICSSNDTGFEYELPDVSPNVWTPVPTTAPSGHFLGITNGCQTSSSLAMTMDFSSEPVFSSMTLGSSRTIRFRNINSFGISNTEEMTITYSILKLSGDRFIYGQGVNNTLTSGTHTLRGHVISIGDNDSSTSSTYTLRGRTVFQ